MDPKNKDSLFFGNVGWGRWGGLWCGTVPPVPASTPHSLPCLSAALVPFSSLTHRTAHTQAQRIRIGIAGEGDGSNGTENPTQPDPHKRLSSCYRQSRNEVERKEGTRMGKGRKQSQEGEEEKKEEKKRLQDERKRGELVTTSQV